MVDQYCHKSTSSCMIFVNIRKRKRLNVSFSLLGLYKVNLITYNAFSWDLRDWRLLKFSCIGHSAIPHFYTLKAYIFPHEKALLWLLLLPVLHPKATSASPPKLNGIPSHEMPYETTHHLMKQPSQLSLQCLPFSSCLFHNPTSTYHKRHPWHQIWRTGLSKLKS